MARRDERVPDQHASASTRRERATRRRRPSVARSWSLPSSPRFVTTGTAVLSAILHILLIGVSVVSTEIAAERLRDTPSQGVAYLPPPDRPAAAPGAEESIRFVAAGAIAGVGRPDVLEMSRTQGPALPPRLGEQDIPSVPPRAVEAASHRDSVYTILDVDTAARSNNSAAPAYPPALLAQHTEGSVTVQFVVDTTGFPDSGSVIVVHATDERFARSLLNALPRMQYRPAKVGSNKVRQMVEQRFEFRIDAPAATRERNAQ